MGTFRTKGGDVMQLNFLSSTRMNIKSLNSYTGLFIALIFCSIVACESSGIPNPSTNAETKAIPFIFADIETKPVPANDDDDAADDPAIFVHPTSPENSLIVGTNKKDGLAVYNLKGEEVFYTSCGLVNNVDLRQNITIGSWNGTLVASSNRSTNSITIHEMDDEGHLKLIGNQPTGLNEVYGFCLGVLDTTLYAFINDKDGRITQWEFNYQPNDTLAISATKVREMKVSTQPEGMVVDEYWNKLYVGEETHGIWVFNALPNASVEGNMLANSSESTNKLVHYDLEGISIYDKGQGNGYLIASSQGSYSYLVFDRMTPNNFLGSFKISSSSTLDGVEETDGLDVTSANLGDLFPSGIAVFQDGYNYDGEIKKTQNFKIVDWRKIQSLIEQF